MEERLNNCMKAIKAFEYDIKMEEILINDLNNRINSMTDTIYELKENKDILEEVARLFQKFSEQEQMEVQKKFESVISYALQIIFKGVFKEFKLVNSVVRNQFVIKPTLVFICDGKETVTDIMESHGGGVSNVIGFLLKLLTLVFQSNKFRPVLFLDESFANLSAEYVPMIAQVINKLVNELGRELQIVLVTHQKEFIDYADTVYKFTKPKSYTVVEKLK